MARAGLWNRTKTWMIEALGGSAIGAMSSAGDQDFGWRPITERAAGKAFRRDLSPLSQENMLKVAHYLDTGSALAQFLINIPVALAVGRSVGYTLEYDHEELGISREKAEDLAKTARRYLDPWWEHPVHDFKRRAQRYAHTYLVQGEILLVIPKDGGVNATTGLPYLDFIDSQLIHDVEGRNGLATTPGRVLVKRVGADPVPFDVILPGIAQPDGSDSGECFFFRHGGRLNSLRGMSDLIAQADWIDLHDQLLFGRVDKAILSNTLVYDLLVKNAVNQKEIDEQVKRFVEASQKPGGTFGHNEKVELNVRTADLKEADNANLLRAILLFILGSKGYPEHWFAEGGNTNRATAGEQNDVSYKMLEGLQEELLGIFQTPLHVGYDRLAERQSIFPPRESGAVTLVPNLPKISERDITKIGTVVAHVESALDAAVVSRRLSRRTAQRVTLTLVEKLTGAQVDPEEETIRIEQEVAEAEDLAQELANAAAAAALKLKKALGDDDDGGGEDPPAPPPARRVRATEAAEGHAGDVEEDGMNITIAPSITVNRGVPQAPPEVHFHAPEAAPAPTPDVHFHAPTDTSVREAVEALQDSVRDTMSELADVAREAVASVPEAVREAIAAQPKPEQPTVNVTVQPAPPTPVYVMPAEVKSPDVKVDVHVPEEGPTETVVERDDKDRIERTVKRPLKDKRR